MSVLSSRFSRLCSALAVLLAASCAADFDTSRAAMPRGSLGHELFTVVCDRVGGQALREDVTGASFHAVCHPDAAGVYAAKVDVSQLPPLSPSVDVDQNPVTVEKQQKDRAHHVARIEALARRRNDLIRAFDAAIPDIRIPRKTTTPKACVASGDPGAADVSLLHELSGTLGRIVDLYNDDTIPAVTEALGRVMNQVKASPDVQAALARFDARQGYRPLPVGLGVARPTIAYPGLTSLAQSLLSLLTAKGDAGDAFQQSLRVLYQEMRAPSVDPPLPVLTAKQDPLVAGKTILSRPRTILEGMREIALAEDPAFAIGTTPAYVARRDPRGYARVPSPGGVVLAPFVDGNNDGLPDIDALGRFVTSDGSKPPSPFFAVDAPDGPRDGFGRALAGGAPLYDFVGAHQTFLAAIVRDGKAFFAVDPSHATETAMNLLAALPVLGGSRDTTTLSSKSYPPDPSAAEAWSLAHKAPAPPNIASTPASLPYRAFHPDDSPLADLVYAFGHVVARPEMDDMLALVQTLAREHPEAIASFVGMALEMKAIADKHPEARLPATSTLWDDLFAVLSDIAQKPGLLEDIVRAFADPATLAMEPTLALFVDHDDDISYDPNNLNGPSINRTTGVTPPSFVTPVDRSKPDSGANRSMMQKFLGLLHDTNGLSICTKKNAIVHINAVLPNTTIPIAFDYPTDRFYSPLVCGLVGSSAPAQLDRCQVFGYTNVMELLLDVLLDKAVLTVRDPCLSKLMQSPLTGLVGGADAFLQAISGVDGFSLHPNLRGFARLLYFETPYPGLPTDTNPKNAKTLAFLRDTIDPIESMVCDPAPFTAPDGTVFPLRKCGDIGDVLRARDPNALFPVDELGFVQSLRPLAAAFKAHNQPLLFARLLDVLHVHYGSAMQTKAECDPSAPRTSGRWCAQDGLVSYEPLLGEILRNGVFARVQSLLGTLASIKVPHCTATDPVTSLCKATTTHDGIHVAAEALSMLVDAKRSPGLVDRKGQALALRNDGTRTDPVAPIHLFADAIDGIDAAFASFAATHAADQNRQAQWRAARGALVDTFLAVDGTGPTARFKNPTLMAILPKIVEVLRAQVATHCAPGSTTCDWAETELTRDFSDTISGPSFAALIDLADGIRRDDSARTELEKLVAYLFDAASSNDAEWGTLAAAADILQVLSDDTNLGPLKRIVSFAAAPSIVDDAGNVVRRGLVDAGLRMMARIFERRVTGTGADQCADERDPNGALAVMLRRFVTPMGDNEATPFEVITSVIGDVNRAAPEQTTKLDAGDYGSIANELSELCLDSSRGLEQFYAVIKQATQ